MALTRALASRFELIDQLGEGSLGQLYRVRERVTHAELALRVTIFSTAEEILHALDSVVTLHAGLESLGLPIVPVVEAGGDSDQAWYAMKSAAGESVLNRIRRSGRMPAPSAARLLRRLTDCVAALHDRGQLHQDLNARSVFITADDSPTVLEVGVAAALARALRQRPGAFSTPRATAPEQLVAAAEPRTDLYALGCLLYYVLTGRKAVSDGAPALRLATQGDVRPPPLDNIAPELRPILARTLAMRPDDRYATAGDLSRALASVGLGR